MSRKRSFRANDLERLPILVLNYDRRSSLDGIGVLKHGVVAED